MSGRTSKEVARAALYRIHEGDFSRETFEAMMRDTGKAGRFLQQIEAAIIKEIEADRAEQDALRAARDIARRA